LRDCKEKTAEKKELQFLAQGRGKIWNREDFWELPSEKKREREKKLTEEGSEVSSMPMTG